MKRLLLVLSIAACTRSRPPVAPGAPAASPPALSPPTGSAAVGRRTIGVAAPDHALVVDLWYPTPKPGARPLMYARPGSGYAAAVAGLLGIEAALLGKLEATPTHAYRDAPIAPGPHPLVLFAPGWGGPPTQNTALAEELASHGYVFASVGFTGESALIERPDGTTATIDQARIAAFFGEAETAAPHFQAWMAATDPAVRARERAAFVAASPVAAARAHAWTAELVAVAEALAREPGVDADRLVVAGMSFGGGVAAAACAGLPHCRGSIDVDGFAPGAADIAPRHPHLIVEGITGAGASDDLLQSDQPVWRIHVERATHLDFTDLVELAPASELHGEIAGATATRILRDAVRSFADCALRGTGGFAIAARPGVTVAQSAAAAGARCTPP